MFLLSGSTFSRTFGGCRPTRASFNPTHALVVTAAETLVGEPHKNKGWMDGWMDGRTDGRTDGRMDGWMDGWTDGWMDGWS